MVRGLKRKSCQGVSVRRDEEGINAVRMSLPGVTVTLKSSTDFHLFHLHFVSNADIIHKIIEADRNLTIFCVPKVAFRGM